MNLIKSEKLSVKRIFDYPKAKGPHCEVILNSVPTGQFVQGAILEAAAEWQGFYLLFTTDDSPFEDFLYIHLLDSDLGLLDSAMIGGMYSTGSFSLLESPEPDTLWFRFIGDTDWSVQVLPKPSFRLPLISEPTGVSRTLGFKRHFIVRGEPQPER